MGDRKWFKGSKVLRLIGNENISKSEVGVFYLALTTIDMLHKVLTIVTMLISLLAISIYLFSIPDFQNQITHLFNFI